MHGDPEILENWVRKMSDLFKNKQTKKVKRHNRKIHGLVP